MKNKILKINSWVLKLIGCMLIILPTIYLIYTLSIPSEPNSWDDLGKFIVAVTTFITYVIGMPFLISGFKSGKIKKDIDKKRIKISKISSVISIVLSVLLVLIFIVMDIADFYSDFVTGHINIGLKIIHTLAVFVILILPQLINIFSLSKKNIFKEKKEKL